MTTNPNLTQYEVESWISLYPTSVDTKDGKLYRRLQYRQNRVTLFESPGWVHGEDATPAVGAFVKMCAHHDLTESDHRWSPAHVGYTVRCYRQSKVPYLLERAAGLTEWAHRYFRADEIAVFESATK